MTGVSGLVSASKSNVQNVGREVWISDNGSTHHYTEDATRELRLFADSRRQ